MEDLKKSLVEKAAGLSTETRAAYAKALEDAAAAVRKMDDEEEKAAGAEPDAEKAGDEEKAAPGDDAEEADVSKAADGWPMDLSGSL